jgi:hypothetical protein
MKPIHRTFDRIQHHDKRSRQFPIRAMIRADAVPITKIWDCYTVLDQGTEGACTGFGTACEAACEPVAVRGVNNLVARAVYHRARELDTFPGEDYEGSTVLGAVKAAVELGWYSEYRWAFSIDDLILAVCHKGPAIIGSNWYSGMGTPDGDNYIHATGKVQGGHCWCLVGWDVKRNAGRVQNSWGAGWGDKGRCWIGRRDLKRLAADGGEACIPIIRGEGKTI